MSGHCQTALPMISSIFHHTCWGMSRSRLILAAMSLILSPSQTWTLWLLLSILKSRHRMGALAAAESIADLLAMYWDQLIPAGQPLDLTVLANSRCLCPERSRYIYFSLLRTQAHLVEWQYLVVWGLKLHSDMSRDSLSCRRSYFSRYFLLLQASPLLSRVRRWSWLLERKGMFYLLRLRLITGLNVQPSSYFSMLLLSSH